MNWSRKYGRQKQLIDQPQEYDLFVAGTQAANNASSAHAFAIYLRDTETLACPIQDNVSDGESRQERACLSAIVRALQIVAPDSHIRLICRLENVVETIKGHRILRANSDILDEIGALAKSKAIELRAFRPHCSRQDQVLTELLWLAQ